MTDGFEKEGGVSWFMMRERQIASKSMMPSGCTQYSTNPCTRSMCDNAGFLQRV